MSKCINDECIFAQQCYTYMQGEGEEISFPLVTFKKECEHYYPFDLDTVDTCFNIDVDDEDYDVRYFLE